MELKRGDKFIVPMIEVVDDREEFKQDVYIKVGDLKFAVPVDLFSECRKVLGLLGDPGLEAQVGMKVWCAVFGSGEIIKINCGKRYPIMIMYGAIPKTIDSPCFTPDGKYLAWTQRTVYVTAMPEEPKGWAWEMSDSIQSPLTRDTVTKKQAEEMFGDKLIHWIPEGGKS